MNSPMDARSTPAAEIADFAARSLAAAADPVKAAPMAVYMKTDMPFYGVQKPGRARIARLLKRRFSLEDRREYEAAVQALWRLPHREEKYLAVQVAMDHPRFIGPDSMPLYERIIREGGWWDLVDDAAIRLVGRVLKAYREQVSTVIDAWIEDDDLWIRRSALISQVGHRDITDFERLFVYCAARAHEKEFFIRKAIGWALRDYSYAAPQRVAAFLRQHRARLSGLSFREGAKVLRRNGYTI